MARKKKALPRRIMVNLTAEEFLVLEAAQGKDAVPRSFSSLARVAIMEVYSDR